MEMGDKLYIVYIALIAYAIIFSAIGYLVYNDEIHIDRNINSINNNSNEINNNIKLLQSKFLAEEAGGKHNSTYQKK